MSLPNVRKLNPMIVGKLELNMVYFRPILSDKYPEMIVLMVAPSGRRDASQDSSVGVRLCGSGLWSGSIWPFNRGIAGDDQA